MITTTLDARFVEEVGEGGFSSDEVRFAADFTRLVVRTLGLVTPTNPEREALILAVCHQNDWGEGTASDLLELALLPEFRDGLRDDELWAFAESRVFGRRLL